MPADLAQEQRVEQPSPKAQHARWPSDGERSGTGELLAVLNFGFAVVSVHQRDHVDGDLFWTCRLTLAMVGA